MSTINMRISSLIILGSLIFTLYYNTLDNSPTNWDDPALFTYPYIHGFSHENLKHVLTFQKGMTYQPIRDISYMIDFSLWKGNPIYGMHFHSIVLYCLMVFAAWIFLVTLFKAFNSDESFAFTWATISTFIFAVHPGHVEDVAWLYARKEPLLGIFSFLSLWLFIKGRSRNPLFSLASFLFLVLAILSKPVALVVPAVMIMIDLVLQKINPVRGFWRKRLLLYVSMFILVVPLMVRLVHMLSSAGGIQPHHGGNIWNNLFAVSQIFISYISLIGFSLTYTADYPIQLYPGSQYWQAWAYLFVNLVLLGSAVGSFFKGRYVYTLFVAWFYIFLLPVSHLYPLSQIMADRYFLMSSLSWCVLLGYIITWLWYKQLTHSRLSPDFPRLISITLFAIIICSYASMTIKQNDVWQNGQTLWEHTLARYPHSNPAIVNLSNIYISQGHFSKAIPLCMQAVRGMPYDYMALSNLALAQMLMGQVDDAIQNYKQVLAIPHSDSDRASLGIANAYWEKHDMANVYNSYINLMRSGFNPDTASYGSFIYYRLGYAAWKLKKKDEAECSLNKSYKLAWQYPPVLKGLAEVYTSMGNTWMANVSYQNLLNFTKDKQSRAAIQSEITKLKR